MPSSKFIPFPGEYDVAMSKQPLVQGEIDYFVPPEQVSITDLRKYRGHMYDVLRNLQPGQFSLDGGQFIELAEHRTIGKLYEVENFEHGRHQNRHGLVFGQLVMNTAFERDRQIFVAVKPFDTPKDALKEYLASRYINGIRRPVAIDDGVDYPQDSIAARRTLTFNPLGFHRFSDNGQFGLVTEFDETVKSFDNIFWDPNNLPTQEQVRRALSRCAFGLARLHIVGVSHGDSSVKNMASDNIGIRYIDLESLRPLPITLNDRSVIENQAYMKRDIGIFIGSLNSGIEQEPVDYSDALNQAFDRYYLRIMQHPSARELGDARLSAQDIQNIIEEEM